LVRRFNVGVKTKAKTKRMQWLWGDKKRGVSLYRLDYQKPQWRVAFWKNGRLYRTEEYPTKGEALVEGRAYAKEVKTGGFIH